MKFVAGTNSKGQVYEYNPYFKIPQNVASHTDGYVVLYHDDIESGDVIPIDDFFTEYIYSSSTNRLYDIGVGGIMPNPDSVATQNPQSSRKVSGFVNTTGYGFDMHNPGTYIIKMLPGTAYWIDDGIDCINSDCDVISVISTDSNLLGITQSGLTIASSARFGLTQDTTVTRDFKRLGVLYYWDARADLKVSAPINNVQISDASNIRSTPSVRFSMNEDAWCKSTYSSPSRAYSYREIGNYTFVRSSFTPDTQTIDGLTFIDSIYATSSDEMSWQNLRGGSTRMWCYATTYMTENKPRVADFHSSSRVAVYDVGVPVRSHMAYWSQNTSDAMYSTGTTTKHNPSVVVIDDNDTYMIVEKKSHGRIEIGSDYVNRTIGLTITNLPPNKAYQINDNYGLVIYGSTNDNGIISIPYEPGLFSVAGDLSLNILHDMDVFNEMSGMSVYDIKNRASLSCAKF